MGRAHSRSATADEIAPMEPRWTPTPGPADRARHRAQRRLYSSRQHQVHRGPVHERTRRTCDGSAVLAPAAAHIRRSSVMSMCRACIQECFDDSMVASGIRDRPHFARIVGSPSVPQERLPTKGVRQPTRSPKHRAVLRRPGAPTSREPGPDPVLFKGLEDPQLGDSGGRSPIWCGSETRILRGGSEKPAAHHRSGPRKWITSRSSRRGCLCTHPNVPAMNVPATSPITRNSTIAAMITTPVYPAALSGGAFIRIGSPR